MSAIMRVAMAAPITPWQLLELLGAFVAFVLLACAISPGCGCSAFTPCSPADQAAENHLRECQDRIAHDCIGLTDAECPAARECSRWAEQRCEVTP